MFNELALFFQQNPWFLFLATGLLGLVVGSFLNVVVYRLPKMMARQERYDCQTLLNDEPLAPLPPFNLSVPPSHCPHCRHPISAWENIPIFSYLIQKGRCRHCQHKISARYPLVELCAAILALMVTWQLGFVASLLPSLLLTWTLLALSLIDFDEQLLPDDITLPLLWLGLLLNIFHVYTDLTSAVIGAIAGYLSLWTVYQLFKLITGKEGMGYGDFKLFAALGAWLGWQALPMILLLSSLVGTVLGVALIVFRGHDKNIPIPFGPYLACAGWLALLWGEQWLHYSQYLTL
jgi:leader peptidase (prepilin peptidase)/N-methyltransferase